MKVTVDTKEFKTAIENAEKAIDYKSLVSVCQTAKIKVENNKCYIYSSNLENFVRTSVDALGDCEDGEFIFSDIKAIIKAIKFFKNCSTTISFSKPEGIMIQCGDKKANVTYMDTEYIEFPQINEFESYTYASEKLFDRMKIVEYATFASDTRPVQQGIHFNACDIVGLDGFRMAVNTDNGFSVAKKFTVPKSVIKFAKAFDGDVDIKVSSKYFCIENSNTSVISRLLDGEYFDYKQAIPNNSTEIKIKRESILEGLKYFKSFIGKDAVNHSVGLRGNAIYCNTNEGVFESVIHMDSTVDYDIGFNADYMIDSLTQFKDEDVLNFYMPDRNNQAMIIKNENNLSLILPVRLDETRGNYPFKKLEKSA